MKHILMVAFHFPPSASAGTFRSLRFAKYLGTYGWKVSVLTVEEPAEGKELGLQIPTNACVYRTKIFEITEIISRFRNLLYNCVRKNYSNIAQRNDISNEKTAPSRWQRLKDTIDLVLSFPDRKIGWFPFAVLEGRRIIRRRCVDVIYSSGPPHSSHFVGWALKRLTCKPWVVDFRDPWARDPFVDDRQKRRWRQRGLQWLERGVIQTADRVILNTDYLRREFVSYYHWIAEDKFTCIPNGFDPVEFSNIRSNKKRGVFRLVHAGTLYKKRNPLGLLQAVRKLIDEGCVSRGRIEILLIGLILLDGFPLEETIQELGLQDVVQLIPPVPHQQCLSILAASDALLVVQPGTDVQVPGKIYEYLYLGKPVLALAHEGATADFVRENDLGYVAEPGCVDEVARGIQYLYRDFLEGMSRRTIPNHVLQRYDVRMLTKKLAALLTECVGPKIPMVHDE